MAEIRPQNTYDGIAFIGGFDVLRRDHEMFLDNGVSLASSVASFDHVYVGVDSDKVLNQRKGELSPFFSFGWRGEDIKIWGSARQFGAALRIEEAVPIASQQPNRLIVISDEYRDSLRLQGAIDRGAHVLFTPPINTLHTSDLKDLLLQQEQTSNCIERQVGAVLLRKGAVVDVGSNGGGPGSCLTCPKGLDKRKRSAEAGRSVPSPLECTFAHAEISALAKAQTGDDLLVTVSPCPPCAEAIVEQDIDRVVYLRDWVTGQPESQGTTYLKQHGVRIRQAGYRPDSPNN